MGQAQYYDEECDQEFEISRPHACGRLYQYLIRQKFWAGLDLLGVDLAGKTVLEVCCGSGMMTEHLVHLGARVTGTDLSPGAIRRAGERARRYAFKAEFLVADVRCLPFPDRHFDVVAVHDGLHHLEDPLRAVEEMARVARRGVLILEPARAVLTRLAVHLGIAREVEEAGNSVYRFAPREIASGLRRSGFEPVVWRRMLMYYQHQPFTWFRWFDRTALFLLFRAVFWSVNLALGRWGNKLALAATRETV